MKSYLPIKILIKHNLKKFRLRASTLFWHLSINHTIARNSAKIIDYIRESLVTVPNKWRVFEYALE